MAEVILAKSAGFCFGVKRAVEMVYEQAEKGGKIYTYGPIIHNEQVVEDLKKRGVSVIENEGQLKQLQEGTVIIRSHGVPKRIQDLILDRGLKYVDATCPFVKKIHNVVMDAAGKGEQVIIIGSDTHPEVEGIKGWCPDLNPAAVIETEEEAQAFTNPSGRDLCIVSQTTFNQKKFQELVAILEKKGYHVNVVNTICNATFERQKEAREIASKADAMIVIGGIHSSNTQKLYEICKRECEDTQYIQTLDDLKRSPDSISCVGITAGASTPNTIIEEVQKYVRTYF
ncbi:MAG: 4-hydroxy-3-methylbut-2-enyl diphosphate reductase [Lachnospiraceae bacterium]|nr:4-hydroxy-3-methylbut-2-enyl diphosphate reductase [Lachnospiraceae bacterium]